jgi:hypothetical protein
MLMVAWADVSKWTTLVSFCLWTASLRNPTKLGCVLKLRACLRRGFPW